MTIHRLMLCLLLCLMGCTPLSQMDQARSTWTIRGKATVIHHEKKAKLRFIYHHSPKEESLILMDPLGLESLTFHHATGQTWAGSDPHQTRAALEAKLGFPIPLNTLPKWIVGNKQVTLPTPWTMRYLDYHIWAGHKHPSIIELKAPDLVIRLVIRKYAV